MILQKTDESAQAATELVGKTCVMAPSKTPSARTILGPRRLRVLHVFNYLGLGGTELTALRVITNLDTKQFENVICGVRGIDPQVVPGRYPGIEVIVPSARTEKSSTQIFSLLDVIRTYKPDIVHSRNWGTIESVPAAWFARVPGVIHSEHGYEVETLNKLPRRRRIFRRAVYGLADVIFTVSGELREFHARQAWISPGGIRVIANGVDTEILAPKPHMKRLLREKLQVPIERFVIGSLGRLVPIKDHLSMLKAAEILHQRGSDIHVLLVGSGPELQRHESYVKESGFLSGRVTFLAATENVVEALNAMDVFVLPSLSEGMSNTLLEAMACGLPVVATRVGGNPEVVEENCSGLLFAPGNVAELSDCVSRLSKDHNLCSEFGEAARNRILSRFSLGRMVENYSQLYLELGVKTGVLSRGPA
jgi:sugar transferase (PEP-CTERM/EpsH1 system associated)